MPRAQVRPRPPPRHNADHPPAAHAPKQDRHACRRGHPRPPSMSGAVLLVPIVIYRAVRFGSRDRSKFLSRVLDPAPKSRRQLNQRTLYAEI